MDNHDQQAIRKGMNLASGVVSTLGGILGYYVGKDISRLAGKPLHAITALSVCAVSTAAALLANKVCDDIADPIDGFARKEQNRQERAATLNRGF